MSYTEEGMIALVDQYRADLFSRPQTIINDAARTYEEIRAYAAALASQPNTPPEPHWIVNDLGELGVEIAGRFYFLYKGDNIEYGRNDDIRGAALHDDGTPMQYRMVGKREFGEACFPAHFYKPDFRIPIRYTMELVYTPGLSFGKPEDGAWKPLPAAPSPAPEGKQP